VVQEIAGSEEAGLRLSATAAQGIVSADLDTMLVSRAYNALLGREVEAGGLESWTTALDVRRDMDQLASGIIGSAEYAARAGQSDADFVKLLYQDVLDRAADESGFANWTGNLAQGASRATVATGFLLSVEAIQKLYKPAADGVLIA
jgi:hypothetical protein